MADCTCSQLRNLYCVAFPRWPFIQHSYNIHTTIDVTDCNCPLTNIFCNFAGSRVLNVDILLVHNSVRVPCKRWVSFLVCYVKLTNNLKLLSFICELETYLGSYLIYSFPFLQLHTAISFGAYSSLIFDTLRKKNAGRVVKKCLYEHNNKIIKSTVAFPCRQTDNSPIMWTRYLGRAI